MGKLNCCVPNCVNSWRNSPGIKWHSLPKDKTILKEYKRLIGNETLKEFSPNTRICGLHFPGGERMSRTQLPSIFPWTEPSKTRREIVKNELPKTRKRKKDEDKVQSSSDSVSSLNQQSTSNAVGEIQRLPSETVRSVSSHVESSASNTEDEIQRSHIILEKLKESKLKRKKFRDF